MNFDEFTGQLQHRLDTPGTGETVRAARATLSTLGARIPAEAAEDLDDLRGMLPGAESDENWGKLFAVVDSGGWVDPNASAH